MIKKVIMAQNKKFVKKFTEDFATRFFRDRATAEKLGKIVDQGQAHTLNLRGITLVATAFEEDVLIQRSERTSAEKQAGRAVKKQQSDRKSNINPLPGGSCVGKIMQTKAAAVNTYMPVSYDRDMFLLEVEPVISQILHTIKSDLLHQYGFTLEEINAGNVPKEVRMGAALDGAESTANKGILAMVLRAIDAVFLENIYIQEEDDQGRLNFSGVQSQGLLTLMGILLGEDNKQNNYKLSKYFFDYFERLRMPNQYFYDEKSQLYFKIKCIFTLDLKALQGVTGRGGGSAIKEMYCTHTAMRRSNKGDHSPFYCDICFDEKQVNGSLEHPCCHMKTMNTAECDKVIADGYKWIDWPKSDGDWETFCFETLYLTEDDIPQVDKGLNKFKEIAKKYKIYLSSTVNVEKLKEVELDRSLAVLDACPIEDFRNSLLFKKPLLARSFVTAQAKFAASDCFAKIQRYPLPSNVALNNPNRLPLRVRNTSNENNIANLKASDYDNNPVRLEFKRKLLIFLIHESARAEYVAGFSSDDFRTLFEIDNAALCVLHAEGRIGEWLFTKLSQESQLDGTPAEKVQRVKNIEKYINQVLSGKTAVIHGLDDEVDLGNIELENVQVDDLVDEDGERLDADDVYYHTSFRIKVEKNIVGHIKVSVVRLRKLFARGEKFLQEALKGVTGAEEKEVEYTKIFNLYDKIKETFHQTELHTDAEVAAFRKTSDDFGRQWKKMFGPTKITNYVSLFITGTFANILEKERTFAHLSGSCLEGHIGSLKCLLGKGTSHGGGKYTTAENQIALLQQIASRAQRNVINFQQDSGADMSQFDEAMKKEHQKKLVRWRTKYSTKNSSQIRREQRIRKRERDANEIGYKPYRTFTKQPRLI